MSGLFVAGKGSFHDELIAKAGGQNACAVAVPYPRISAEGLFAMNPDIIIEFISDDEAKNASPADWKDFDTVGAVKNGRIHIVTGDRSFIPGPRAPLLLEELARLIHPENGATP